GQPQAPCTPNYPGDGDMFQCFDANDLTHGVSLITSFAQSQPASPPPAVYGVWPLSACGDGGSFFSDTSISAGATTCNVSVNAQVDFGTGAATPTQQLVATVNGTDIRLV